MLKECIEIVGNPLETRTSIAGAERVAGCAASSGIGATALSETRGEETPSEAREHQLSRVIGRVVAAHRRRGRRIAIDCASAAASSPLNALSRERFNGATRRSENMIGTRRVLGDAPSVSGAAYAGVPLPIQKSQSTAPVVAQGWNVLGFHVSMECTPASCAVIERGPAELHRDARDVERRKRAFRDALAQRRARPRTRRRRTRDPDLVACHPSSWSVRMFGCRTVAASARFTSKAHRRGLCPRHPEDTRLSPLCSAEPRRELGVKRTDFDRDLAARARDPPREKNAADSAFAESRQNDVITADTASDHSCGLRARRAASRAPHLLEHRRVLVALSRNHARAAQVERAARRRIERPRPSRTRPPR